MHASVESHDGGSFNVTISNAFPVIWNLTGIMTRVVGKRSFRPALVVHFRLPLDIRGWVKLIDFKFRLGIRSKTTDRAVHDVAGHSLYPIHKISVFLFIQGTIIHL